MRSYLDYIDYKEEDGFVILRLIEDYLRESVDALDAFSRYIRNNNLQTLQAPNYNIESNTSMEKILIAFSEYAFMIIEDYIDCNTVCLKREDLPAKRYIPVVVPNLGKKQVSVEVMFPEWNIYRNQDFKNHVQKYLLIVTCPTVKELGNVPIIAASLLHEIAHQFRYESREIRNDSILRYVLMDFFELLSDRIIQEFEVLKSNYKLRKRIICIFRKVLLETFLEEWLEVMQHHGVKTRAMDWSESAIHSLMFALEPFFDDKKYRDEERRNTVPCVWILEPGMLNKNIFKCLLDKALYNVIFQEFDESIRNRIVNIISTYKDDSAFF